MYTNSKSKIFFFYIYKLLMAKILNGQNLEYELGVNDNSIRQVRDYRKNQILHESSWEIL